MCSALCVCVCVCVCVCLLCAVCAVSSPLLCPLPPPQQVQDMVQAVMEGVSYALRDCLQAIRLTGTEPASLVAIGGGAASE